MSLSPIPLSMIDHDRLFKELLSTFFEEFLQVFFPQVWEAIESDSWMFLDIEDNFTTGTGGSYGNSHKPDGNRN